jgi:hypothetical protein
VSAAANQFGTWRSESRWSNVWPKKNKSDKVMLAELTVSSRAIADAVAKLLIAKGSITDEELKAQLSTERANYLAVVKRLQ